MKYTLRRHTAPGDGDALYRSAVSCPRLLLKLGLLVGISCGPAIGQPAQASSPPPESTQTTPICTYSIVNTFPHDPYAFTQGLVLDNGDLFEGTGLWGESTLRRVDLETGAVLQILNLSAAHFGEGVTVHNNRLIQLTYQSGIGFVYNRNTFALLDSFTYPAEGWGLTHDRQRLIMSDGSSTLHFRDPQTFVETGQVQVFDDQGPVVRLNELEYIHGEVLAN
ncbi:MAG: glutaminyl-peptide cyclotransferase, partial [Thermoanaerobaculales bacterium]